jgi:hypothetical protein
VAILVPGTPIYILGETHINKKQKAKELRIGLERIGHSHVLSLSIPPVKMKMKMEISI